MPIPSQYNPNIPKPTDDPSVSQNDLLLNFGALQALIDVDHVDFAVAGAGKHNKVTLPLQAVAPAFAAGENGVYNLLPVAGALTGVDEIYLRKQISTGGTNIPMTASI